MNDITFLAGSTKSDIHKYTPMGFMGIRLNSDNLPCGGDSSGGDDDEGGDDEGGGGDTPTSYTVAATAVTRTSSGSVVSTTGGTVSPASQEVNPGSSASMTASAKTNYTFRGWATTTTATSYLSTSTTYAPTPTGNASYYAIFEYTGGGDDPTPTPSTKHTVTVTTSGGGTVTGSGEYEDGEDVLMVASAYSGYHFVRYEVQSIGWSQANNPLTLIMSSAWPETFTVNCVFEADSTPTTYTLVTAVVPAGAGRAVPTESGPYAAGSTVTVTATANEGYSFYRWKRDGVVLSTSNPYSFTMPNENTSITAEFAKNAVASYVVTISKAPTSAGSVSGAGTYSSGSTATVTATPASGYTFAGWKSGGTVVSTSNPYSFTVTGDTALLATFAADSTPTTYTQSINSHNDAGGGDTIFFTYTPVSPITVTYKLDSSSSNSTVTIPLGGTVTADGWEWTDDTPALTAEGLNNAPALTIISATYSYYA